MMNYAEGSVTEWSARWTRNSAVPGSSLALATCWICSSATLVNSQLHGCLLPGFEFCYVAFELFVSKYLSGVPAN